MTKQSTASKSQQAANMTTTSTTNEPSFLKKTWDAAKDHVKRNSGKYGIVVGALGMFAAPAVASTVKGIMPQRQQQLTQ